MPKPVQIQIVDEIAARLLNISIANGYSIDIKSIKRAKLTPFHAGDIPAINYWPVTDSLADRSFGKDTRELGITIELHDRTRDDPFTDRAFIRGADIVMALFRDTAAPFDTDAASTALGGLIDTLIIDSITPMIGEGQAPFCGVILAITAKYKTNLNDIFTIL